MRTNLPMFMIPHKLRGAAAAGFGAVFLCAHPAAAQQLAVPGPATVTPAGRYTVHPLSSGFAVAATSGLWLAAEAFKSDLPHATCAPCDPSHLPGIDRWILGPVRPSVSNVSDATLLLTLAGAGALVYGVPATRGERGEDLAVWVQAVSASSAVTAWSKVLFHRPRPVLYGADAVSHATPDNGLSFPSGHASLAFAAAMAMASIEHRRNGHVSGAARAAVFATAATTALLRVVARRHFPTDVTAGALLGGAVGWIVPSVYPLR